MYRNRLKSVGPELPMSKTLTCMSSYGLIHAQMLFQKAWFPSPRNHSLMTCVHIRLKEGTLNWEILQFKSKFLCEVLLCRVSDFYEALGIDACILVEYAGLNPFGGLRSDSIPRAGCPVGCTIVQDQTRMHWMDDRALRRKDDFRGKRLISNRETISKLCG
ncbi:hypothetical protein FNV43_RR21732 [Rhamnella rubrinervis]|uniref:Uncharacterized protein n=1 Tax=Rhamnella rubrinervis TaxID=2594499 RepID=A0A8K0E0K3_9ROSA|nr:hypothetical protein FNV43_RR21732 [Rhamnella rubrinervis]